MQDTIETTTELDATDQGRAVLRFIADHELPFISLTVSSRPLDGEPHVRVHVFSSEDYDLWFSSLESPVTQTNHIADTHEHFYATSVPVGLSFPIVVTYCQRLAVAR